MLAGAPLQAAGLSLAGVAPALRAALLSTWDAARARHPPTAQQHGAQGAAQRSEHALHLLVHLHVLALSPMPTGGHASPEIPATCSFFTWRVAAMERLQVLVQSAPA